MRSTSRSASDDRRTLPDATQWSGVGAPGPVADGDEVRAVDLGDGEQRVAVEDAEAGRLVGQPGESLQLRAWRSRAGRACARPSRRGGSRPARGGTCRSPRPARRGRASGASPAAATPSTCAGRAVGRARSRRPRPGESPRARSSARRPVDRADRVPVKHHRIAVAQPAAGRRPCRRAASTWTPPCARVLERRVERVRERRQDAVDDVARRRAPRT